jgi:hypothetical protein
MDPSWTTVSSNYSMPLDPLRQQAGSSTVTRLPL